MNVVAEPWTVDRFLAWEDGQERKHEFDGVRPVPRSAGSYAHQRVIINLVVALGARLDRSRFGITQEMRLRMPGRVRYPDVCVTPGAIGQRVRALDAAIALFEVLSDDTAETDRAAKRAEYATLDDARHYVLLEQERIAATVFSRAPGGDWVATRPAEGAIALPALGVDLPLAEIYAGLMF